MTFTVPLHALLARLCKRAQRAAIRPLRCTLLGMALALAACAGPETRIDAPAPAASPLHMAAARGAASADEETRLIAQAMGGTSAGRDGQALITRLRSTIAHTSLVAGNQVQLLTDGPSTFREFAQAIANAVHHIHVETFMFSNDRVGLAFAELLAEKCRQGVEVRVLYDGFGSWAMDDAPFRLMREAGVEVQSFQPMDSIDAVVSGRVNQRDHRKLLIVDGQIAFVGGINISGTYNSASSAKPGREPRLDDGWRDTQVRITGPVVQQFQALFFATWARAAGTPAPVRDDYFPAQGAAGSSIIAALASEHGTPNEAAIHGVHVAVAQAARRCLWITQAYFTPDSSLREALIGAARRGVDVRVLVPGFSDSEAVLNASRAIYGQLLEGHVRIFEYDAAFVHAKTLVVDGSVSLVGSANMDYRSAVDNNEVTALIIDAGFGQALGAAFARDLVRAREVRLAQWRERPLQQRVMERAATWLWRWL